MADYQDWNTVTWEKRGPTGAKAKDKSEVNKAARSGNVDTNKKFGADGNQASHSKQPENAAKLEALRGVLDKRVSQLQEAEDAETDTVRIQTELPLEGVPEFVMKQGKPREENLASAKLSASKRKRMTTRTFPRSTPIL